ncbi:hypothetical protein F0223_06725 [Vibrio coralliilyticus]|uniref:hypothetical protein n=1 Tax=Vibrio coralliilyticus TaxID=190893 RepID=UPI00148DF09B|nr:hypothetical protein [Vibrio coralliilyticus]NOI17923.1 hypothetical protein [Vibrio coralliilyticus]
MGTIKVKYLYVGVILLLYNFHANSSPTPDWFKDWLVGVKAGITSSRILKEAVDDKQRAVSPNYKPIAIGLPSEDSCGSGIGGEEANPNVSCSAVGPEDNSLSNSGAVILTWQFSQKTNRVLIKSPNPDAEDNFGKASSFSSDYKVLAIGAPGEDGCYLGVNGTGGIANSKKVTCSANSEPSLSNGFYDSGAVYVYSGNGNFMAQDSIIDGTSVLLGGEPVYIKSPNVDEYDGFGSGVKLSGDGKTLAISAPYEDNCGTGVGGKGNNRNLTLGKNAVCGYGDSKEGLKNNEALNSGAMYIYSKAGDKWQLAAYIKSPNPDAGDYFGSSFALSASGNRLLVGAPGEDSCGTGIGGRTENPNEELGSNPVCGSDPVLNMWDNSAIDSGAVYVYEKVNNKWVYRNYIKPSNTNANDKFGSAITYAFDDRYFFVGSPGEQGCGAGIGGTIPNVNQKVGRDNACGENAKLGPTNNSLTGAGAVYGFLVNSGLEQEVYYIKSPAPDSGDRFGSIILPLDEKTLAISSPGEDSCIASSKSDISGPCSWSSIAENYYFNKPTDATIRYFQNGMDYRSEPFKQDNNYASRLYIDNNKQDSGSVYVLNLEKHNDIWDLLKPTQVNAGDAFGTAMTKSSSPYTGKSVLFIGAPGYDSSQKLDVGKFGMYPYNKSNNTYELTKEFFVSVSDSSGVDSNKSTSYYTDTTSPFDYAGAVAPSGGGSAVKQDDSSCDLAELSSSVKGVSGIADFLTCLGKFGVN